MAPTVAEDLQIEALRRDLEWKRAYLRELEKKKHRQEAAVADTEAELTARRTEIAELEERLDALREDND